MGSCTAGGAYCPRCRTRTYRAHQGRFSSAGRAGEGHRRIVTAENSAARRASRQSGVTDHYAQNAATAIAIAVALSHLEPAQRAALNMRESREPLFSGEEIYGVVERDGRKSFDVLISSAVVDGSEFDEFKKLYGQTRSAFAHIWAIGRLIATMASCSARAR